MYQTRLVMDMSHEYFADSGLCHLNVQVLDSTAKLLQAMDWLLIPRQEGFALASNGSRWSDDELLEHFGNERLVIVLTPKNHSLFFSVSAGLKQTMSYSRMVNQSGETIQIICKCPGFHLIEWYSSDSGLFVKSYPVDYLLEVTSVAQVKGLSTPLADKSITDGSQVDQTPSESLSDDNHGKSVMQELHESVRRKSSMVCEIPVKDLVKKESVLSKKILQNSVCYRLKYYLLGYSLNESLSIKHKTTRFVAGSAEISRGRKVQTFTSEDALALSLRPQTYPTLIENHNGQEITLIDNMPYPRPDSLGSHDDSSNSPATFAESFIN